MYTDPKNIKWNKLPAVENAVTGYIDAQILRTVLPVFETSAPTELEPKKSQVSPSRPALATSLSKNTPLKIREKLVPTPTTSRVPVLAPGQPSVSVQAVSPPHAPLKTVPASMQTITPKVLAPAPKSSAPALKAATTRVQPKPKLLAKAPAPAQEQAPVGKQNLSIKPATASNTVPIHTQANATRAPSKTPVKVAIASAKSIKSKQTSLLPNAPAGVAKPRPTASRLLSEGPPIPAWKAIPPAVESTQKASRPAKRPASSLVETLGIQKRARAETANGPVDKTPPVVQPVLQSTPKKA